MGNPDFNYDRKLALLDRDGLIRKIQNQRVEIVNLSNNIETYVHMTVWRAQIIRSAIKYLKEKRPECALGVLRDRVTDGDSVLKELSHEQD